MAVARAVPPVVAISLFVVCVAGIIAIAGSTLGYDYQAYVRAADRLLAGLPLYDPAIDVAGGFAIFLYPPPFALAMVPFAVLPDTVGLWLWIGLTVLETVVAIAILPVRRDVRWLLLALAALDWPVLYSIKLGQVGPLLLLLFAIGWRWLERPVGLGMTIALGTIVKIQPLLLLGWALGAGRRPAVVVAFMALVIAALVSLPLAGVGTWSNYIELMRRVASPITTAHNFTPGALAYQAGLPIDVASAIQALAIGLALAAAAFATLRRSPAAGYVVTIVAAQLASPLLWDHYAIVLLIPTAYLIDRGQRWAIVIPLLTWLPLGFLPAVLAYPLAFGLALLAPIVASEAGSLGDRPRLDGRLRRAPT